MGTSYEVRGTFFHTALAQMKERGALPQEGTFMYNVITQDLGCWITPWRQKAAAYITLLCGISFCLGWTLLVVRPFYPKMLRDPFPQCLIFIPFVAMFFIAWPLVMNGSDPVEFIFKTSRMMELAPEQFCSFSEAALKERARSILYNLAAQHSERQKRFLGDSPEFQETYQKYYWTHVQFQKARLIPRDMGWGPYFSQTATVNLGNT